MKGYMWKTGGVFLLSAAVVLAAVFWPRPQEGSKTDSTAESEARQMRQDRPGPRAEELYRKALLHKEPGASAAKNYRMVMDCCRRILEQYPDSPRAEPARTLLREAQDNYEGLYENQIGLVDRPGPKVKKSRSLHRRMPRPRR